MDLNTLKYPIGYFQRPTEFSTENVQSFIKDIEQFPMRVIKEVGPLTPDQQNWIYRPEGWSIKQVVHHCADSHMNAFTRIKLALTEDNPAIKPYLENEWAKQKDYTVPVVNSIKILEGLHLRWSNLLKSLNEVDMNRTFFHPESKREWSIYTTIALYAWHCNHHLAHILQAKKHQGNFEQNIES